MRYRSSMLEAKEVFVIFANLSNGLWKEQRHSLLEDVVVAGEEEHVLHGDPADVHHVEKHREEDAEPRGEHYE